MVWKFLIIVKAQNGEEEIAGADKYTNIRLFTVNKYFSLTPIMELEDENILQHWSIASKGECGDRATCFSFHWKLTIFRKIKDLQKYITKEV